MKHQLADGPGRDDPWRPDHLTWGTPGSAPWFPAEEADRDDEAEEPPRGDHDEVPELEPGAGGVRVPGGEQSLEEVADRERVGEVENTIGQLVLGDEES